MRPRLRVLLAEIALPLLLLGAVEGGFRVYVDRRPDLPLPHLMSSSIDTGKYLAFRHMEERPRPLDVLFLGISPMMRVDGSYLRDYMSARDRARFRSFNFAGPFHSIELDQRLLADVVFPIETPAVVVYGLMPLNLLNEPSSATIDAFVRTLPAFSLQGSAPPTRLRDFLTEHLLLLQYREVIRDLAFSSEPPQKDPWIRRARQTDPFGDLPLLKAKWEVQGIAAWERKYKARLAHFDSLLANTLLFDHVRTLAKLCRAHDLHLVVMLTPVHPFFLELLPDGQRDYGAFIEKLRVAAEDAGVPFFDPAGGGIGRPELFLDTHHHNEAGTRWLTERIGGFLIENGLLARRSAPPTVQKSTSG